MSKKIKYPRTELFESVYVAPETGNEIIVARGTLQYVKDMAVRSQMVPFKTRKLSTSNK